MKWRGFESESLSGLYCMNWYGFLNHPVCRSSNRLCIGSTMNMNSDRVRVSCYRFGSYEWVCIAVARNQICIIHYYIHTHIHVLMHTLKHTLYIHTTPTLIIYIHYNKTHALTHSRAHTHTHTCMHAYNFTLDCTLINTIKLNSCTQH